MKRARQIILLGVTTLAVAALLAWSFKGVDRREFVEALRRARWVFAPFSFLVGMAVYPLKALRWAILLGPDRQVRFRTLLSAIMIGFMVNCIFSRIGEVVRAAVLSVKKEMSTASALASIALERVFDSCVVLLFLAVSLLWLQPSGAGEGAARLATLRVVGGVACLALAAATTFLVLLRLRPERTVKFAVGLMGWLPGRLRGHAQGFMGTFLTGLDTVRSARQLFAIIALSLVHWLMQVLYFLLAMLCCPELHASLPAALLVFSVTALGVAALPLPGYLGIFHGGILAAAAIIGSKEALKAAWTSYAWIAWLLNIPAVILAGFGFLWIEGLTLGQLRGAKGNQGGL